MAQSGAEYEGLETLVVDGFADDGTLVSGHVCFNHRQVFGLKSIFVVEPIIVGVHQCTGHAHRKHLILR